MLRLGAPTGTFRESPRMPVDRTVAGMSGADEPYPHASPTCQARCWAKMGGRGEPHPTGCHCVGRFASHAWSPPHQCQPGEGEKSASGRSSWQLVPKKRVMDRPWRLTHARRGGARHQRGTVRPFTPTGASRMLCHGRTSTRWRSPRVPRFADTCREDPNTRQYGTHA
jgi:hypothetical protein